MCPAHSQPCFQLIWVFIKVGIKKIVYVDDYGVVNKCKACDYKTNYITPGYKGYIIVKILDQIGLNNKIN